MPRTSRTRRCSSNVTSFNVADAVLNVATAITIVTMAATALAMAAMRAAVSLPPQLVQTRCVVVISGAMLPHAEDGALPLPGGNRHFSTTDLSVVLGTVAVA
jgi:hypothetical protein